MIVKKIFLIIHILAYKIVRIKAFYYSKLFKRCGKNFYLWGNCYIKNPQKIEIGNNVSINDGAYLNGLGGIEIGNNVSISALAKIVSTSLDIKVFKIEKLHINKKITIGNNVQIGVGAIILSGMTIGDNVIVGAGAVVTKDINSNSIAVGNPAKVLRKI